MPKTSSAQVGVAIRYVDGHQELWTLAAILDQENSSSRNREGSVR